MNLGLGNLIQLKQQLLASSLQSNTAYDGKLAAIGIGTARSFEKYCNRKFERAVNEVYQFPADRNHVFTPRYPLESVSLVEFRADMSSGWLTQDSSVILNLHEAIGGVYFVGPFGFWFSFARITYTGGYWFDSSEDGSGTQPAGSTALPEDLKLAWYLQCRKVWEAIDKTGKDITKTAGEGTQGVIAQSLAGLELVPAVEQVLRSYRRFSIT